jgi:hypothetical protein
MPRTRGGIITRGLPRITRRITRSSAAGDRRAWPLLACGVSHSCAGRWARLRCLRKAVASVAANGGVVTRSLMLDVFGDAD